MGSGGFSVQYAASSYYIETDEVWLIEQSGLGLYSCQILRCDEALYAQELRYCCWCLTSLNVAKMIRDNSGVVSDIGIIYTSPVLYWAGQVPGHVTVARPMTSFSGLA